MALKINFLIPAPGLGGGVRMVASHAKYLTEKGHDVEIISRGLRRRSLKGRLQLLRQGKFDFSSGINTSLLDEAGLKVKTWDADIEISERHVRDADITIATWWETVQWLDRLPESKGVKAHFIQGHEAPLPHGFPKQAAAVHMLPTKKIVVSQWLKDVMRREYGVEDCIVVENGVDINRFSAPERAKPPAPTVGFLFSVAGVKNSQLAVAACEELRKRRKDIRVVAFGSHKPDVATPLPRWISFRCRPPQDAIPKIYAQCDVWLFTSREEGFGLPILEAMACGTPVVATGAGAAPEIITGAGGEIVETDADVFARASERYIDMTEAEWGVASAAARARAEAFSLEKSNAAFEKAILALAGNA